MNFNCDNCNARYFIPDERVKGRRVTITCKRCSHKIHIRDGAVASQSGQVGAKHLANKPAIAVAPPPPAASLRPKREKPVWLVAINEVPVGPLPIEEIARKAKLGAVTLESLCWREGLEEWIPAAEVDEIRQAIEQALEQASAKEASPPPRSSQPTAPPPVARTSRPSLSSMLAAESQTESEAEPEGRLPGAWASRSEPSLRLGDDEVEERSSLPFPPPSASQKPRDDQAPHEARDASLASEAPSEPETETETGTEAETEAQAGAAAALNGRPSLSVREGDRDPTPRPSRLSAAPDSAEQAPKPLFLRFALVGLLCGALGYFLGFWHGAQGEAGSIAAAPSSDEAEETGTTRESASTARRPLSAQLRFDDSLAVETEESAGEEAAEEESGASSMAAATKTTRLRPPSSSGSTASSATAAAPAPSTEMRALSAEEKRMLESFSNTGSAPKIGGVTAPSSQVRTTQAGSAPARQTGGLDSASISRVISQNQPSLQQCYERAVRGMPIAQSLRINVHVVIGGSGTVTRAQASGDSLPGLNTCIENAVKRWQFPSAPGGGETRFPVVFSGK